MEMSTINRFNVTSAPGKMYAPLSLPTPGFSFHIDYSVFKKTEVEKGKLLTLKVGVPKARGHKFKTLTVLTT